MLLFLLRNRTGQRRDGIPSFAESRRDTLFLTLQNRFVFLLRALGGRTPVSYERLQCVRMRGTTTGMVVHVIII